MSKRLPDNYCPSCCKLNDGASNLDDETLEPVPGDLSICIHCATILRYNENMKGEIMPVEELLDLEDETRLEVMRMHRAVVRLLESKVIE